MIELEGVSKSYANASIPAVAELDLTVQSGSFHVLLGESGSGKTTVLKMINRLVESSSGRIRVDGEDIDSIDPITLRRRIGYAFQGVGLFPHMTVEENIAIVPRLLDWPRPVVSDRIDELLELMSLPPVLFRRRFPRELSGGQQQRIGVARALAARSQVLLMDEPFGALDPITRDELQAELKRLQRSLALTVVLVTHDVNEALLLADRIAVMKGGRLLAHDTPDRLLDDPPHPYVATLMDMPKRQAAKLAELSTAARQNASHE